MVLNDKYHLLTDELCSSRWCLISENKFEIQLVKIDGRIFPRISFLTSISNYLSIFSFLTRNSSPPNALGINLHVELFLITRRTMLLINYIS